MKMGSLYSGGLDAFAYAGLQVGIEVKWQVEKDYKNWEYLKQNYPNVKRFFTDDQVGKHNLEWVDIICGGDPCQPHSVAGDRRGKADDRYRWPQMFRIIGAMRPNWVVNENVTGTVGNMVLDQKISDLESLGYTCQAYCIPAVAVNACHRRDRVFIVAYTSEQRGEDYSGLRLPVCRKTLVKKEAIQLDHQGDAFLRFEEVFSERAVFDVDDGVPGKIHRMEATGNSIVPQILMVLLGYIKQIDILIKK